MIVLGSIIDIFVMEFGVSFLLVFFGGFSWGWGVGDGCLEVIGFDSYSWFR